MNLVVVLYEELRPHRNKPESVHEPTQERRKGPTWVSWVPQIDGSLSRLDTGCLPPVRNPGEDDVAKKHLLNLLDKSSPMPRHRVVNRGDTVKGPYLSNGEMPQELEQRQEPVMRGIKRRWTGWGGCFSACDGQIRVNGLRGGWIVRPLLELVKIADVTNWSRVSESNRSCF